MRQRVPTARRARARRWRARHDGARARPSSSWNEWDRAESRSPIERRSRPAADAASAIRVPHRISRQPRAARSDLEIPVAGIRRTAASSPRRRENHLPPQAAGLKRANDRYRGRNALRVNSGVEGSNSTDFGARTEMDRCLRDNVRRELHHDEHRAAPASPLFSAAMARFSAARFRPRLPWPSPSFEADAVISDCSRFRHLLPNPCQRRTRCARGPLNKAPAMSGRQQRRDVGVPLHISGPPCRNPARCALVGKALRNSAAAILIVFA